MDFEFLLKDKLYEPNTGIAKLEFTLQKRCQQVMEYKPYMVSIGNFKKMVQFFIPEISSEMYGIVTGFLTFGSQCAEVSKCLIDNDYEGDACFYMPVIMDIKEDVIAEPLLIFHIFTPPKLNYDNVYNYQLFDQFKEDRGTDKVISLIMGSKKANGIDIVFEKNYKICPQGFIELSLEWSANLDFKDKPNLILLRSSYARQGLHLTTDKRRKIILINNSDKLIMLGNRFLQIVPSAAIQFGNNRAKLNLLNVGLYNGTEDIPVKSSVRSNKFEKENENFIIKTAYFF